MAIEIDPVCGMEVDTGDRGAVVRVRGHDVLVLRPGLPARVQGRPGKYLSRTTSRRCSPAVGASSPDKPQVSVVARLPPAVSDRALPVGVGRRSGPGRGRRRSPWSRPRPAAAIAGLLASSRAGRRQAGVVGPDHGRRGVRPQPAGAGTPELKRVAM